MTRLEFCELMVSARKQANVPTSQISFEMHMLLPTLRRMEKGAHNFNMINAMRYINAAKIGIRLSDGKNSYIPSTYDELVQTYISIYKQQHITQSKLAEIIGISVIGVWNIEHSKTKLTIDPFLKVCEYCNVQIEFINRTPTK